MFVSIFFNVPAFHLNMWLISFVSHSHLRTPTASFPTCFLMHHGSVIKLSSYLSLGLQLGSCCSPYWKFLCEVHGCCQEWVFQPNQSANGSGPIQNSCHEWPWGKALREVCCEREQAQMDVPSIEKTNTKEDLDIVMTKSRSKMQTVTNRCVTQKATNWVSSKHPNIRDLIEWAG